MRDDELRCFAHEYNCKAFIAGDPIQIPHRYRDKRDIEISAFVTSWISWGNRRQIIAKADFIDRQLFGGSPLRYIQNKAWEAFREDDRCLYRTYKYRDFYLLCACLYRVYLSHKDMEEAVVAGCGKGSDLAEVLGGLMPGVKGVAVAAKGSSCKRLWMFLRWMVRRDGIVDFGIWQTLSPADLLIPVDTHVYQVARRLGLTTRKVPNRRMAEEITAYFRQVFPGDPALGDFALFGPDVGM